MCSNMICWVYFDTRLCNGPIYLHFLVFCCSFFQDLLKRNGFVFKGRLNMEEYEALSLDESKGLKIKLRALVILLLHRASMSLQNEP